MAHRSHRRAKLTVQGRLLLVHRVLDWGWPRARAAEAQGCSGATAGKWVRRYREEGAGGLVDRSSRPRTSPNRLPAEVEERVLDYRSTHRVGAHQIADALGIPQSTVSAVLARRRVPLLRHLDRPTGQVVRYERDRPGELVHIDVKKQGRIPDGGGWRTHGRSAGVGRVRHERGRKGSGAKLGYDFLHVAVDDHSRVAYVERHDNERGDTAAAFLQRAHAWFCEHGVTVERALTDNGACYRSAAFRQAADTLAVALKKTRPYRPQTNGKVERFNQTLKREWAWAQPYTTNTQRTCALGTFLHRYNHHRPHRGIKGATPMSRLNLNDLPGNHN